MVEVLQIIGQIWAWIMDHLIYINLLFSIIIVFFERRDPKSVWAWLLVLYFVPFFGAVLYVIFGQNHHKSRMFRIKEIEDGLNAQIHRQEDRLKRREFEDINPMAKRYTDLVLYNLESSGSVYTNDNDVEIFTDGEKKFASLIEDIRNAKDHIHFQYYIIRNDEVFNHIKTVLMEKAREGVEVRVLYDGMGSRGTTKKLWKELQSAGVQVAVFFPALFGRLNLRVNYRNHRKIVVIDGKVGYVGGFNVGKEYLGKKKYFGYWRDTHLRIEGSAVASLQIRFIQDWNYAAKDNLFANSRYFLSEYKGNGQAGIQIVSSGPDSLYKNVRNNYLKLIQRARDTIYLQTPYFVPDETVLDALKLAALSGVDVRIMFPCKQDHPFVYWATYSYVGEMIRAGAKCYTYDKGFLHAKGLVCDGKAFCYGTANMDIRSFELNFEVNATVFDEALASRMQALFLEDLSDCTMVTAYEYGQRKVWVRFREQLCRLLAPLL